MRWGLFAGLAVLANGVAAVACDSVNHDAAPRFYIPPPPDSGAGETPANPTPGSPGDDDDVTAGEGGIAEGGPGAPDASVNLALAGFWRASFAAAPWAGSPTSGPSGGQALAAGAAAPTPGAALGGLASADFNGINAFLIGAPVATFQSVTTFSGWALVNIDSVNTDSVTWSQDDTIVCTSGTGEFGVYLRSNGTVASVGVAALSTVDRTVSTTIAMNTWQLVQWRSDGATMSIRVNGGTWASTGTGTVNSLLAPLEIGRNPGQNQFFDGRIADVGLTTTSLSDIEFDAVRAYASARYGLTL